jgi:hypothetical protein
MRSVVIAAAASVAHASWAHTASHVRTMSQPACSATAASSANSRSDAQGITAPYLIRGR